MGLSDALERITDPYDRQARLWPALLALLPLITMMGLLYATSATIGTNAAATAISCGALYFLTNLCREFGKRLEPKLFEAWGGKPSTRLLRHSDPTIEAPTKRRYHAFLASKIATAFPDEAQEAKDPHAADEIYQSAIRWLLNHTRDTKTFSLLFQENIAYGFRRNALGLKPLGLAIAGGCFLWVLVSHVVISNSAEYFYDLSAIMQLPSPAGWSLATSAIMILAWCFYFTEKSVHTSAFAYAEMLLRACDVLTNEH